MLRFIEDRTAGLNGSGRAMMQLAVAAEEIFVNICEYAYVNSAGSARVRISTDLGARTVTLVFEDGGVPYDPTGKQDPDVTLPAEQRSEGGLGIFLTKKLTDDVGYEYRDGKNILTILKKM